MTLEDRLCLVVGGARGIGKSIVAALEEAGATVIGTTSAPTTSSALWDLDVRDTGSVRRLGERLEQEHGHLDVLVYNAGIAGPTKQIEDITEEEWSETIEINLTGLYRVCHATIPLLRQARNGGRIIGIASITGRRPLLQRVPYAASKLAMQGFMRSLALELGPSGITTSTISPGYVTGERIESVIQSQAGARGTTDDEVRSRFLTESPLNRMVGPSSIGRTVCFLADTASVDMTGVDINVSAGVWMD